MKKIFLTMLLACSLTVSPVAAYNVDWNDAPYIGNKLEFYEYMTYCEENLQTIIPMILSDGFQFDWNNRWLFAPVQWKNYEVVKRDGNDTYLVVEIENYPGTRISEAYLRDDTSFLTPDELEIYDAVLEALNDVSPNDFDDEYFQELFLVKFLDEWVSYTTADYSTANQNMPRFVTAVGAFLDRKANCQGYSDAFYMLGNMWGFEVKRVVGYTDGGGLHMWNTITFDDGRTYFVDVTWEDNQIQFTEAGETGNNIYFNAPVEIMKATHTWDESLTGRVVKNFDDRYFYVRTGHFCETCYEACYNIAQDIVNGEKLVYAMAPYDPDYANQKADTDFLYNKILREKFGWNGIFQLYIKHVGNYLFFIADGSSNY